MSEGAEQFSGVAAKAQAWEVGQWPHAESVTLWT